MNVMQYQIEGTHYVQFKQVSCQRMTSKNSQSGVVLFVALIAMLVMSLAAVALIRSVDTNTSIVGNLSYKQTAAISSSFGIESVSDTVGIQNLAYGNANDAGNGYYAICSNFSAVNTTCNGETLTADATWVPGATSRLADGIATGITGGVDAYGNTVQYIVERMCNQVGAATSTTCLLATSDLDNRSHNVCPPNCGAPEVLTELPVYRVTVRIAGPKNTVSYIQAFIS